MNNRLKDLREKLNQSKIDAFLVTSAFNVRYLSGFTGSFGYLLITKKQAYLVTDTRYEIQSKEEIYKGFKVKIQKLPFDHLVSILNRVKIKKLSFESMDIKFAAYERLKKLLKNIALKPQINLVEKIRERKDDTEISEIRKAINIADYGFREARKRIIEQRSEKEVAMYAEIAVKKKGADGLSFNPIVASGVRGALPHAAPSNNKIKKNELIVVDFGVTLNGYNSDQTRTFCLGKVSRKVKDIYNIVKDANLEAISKVKSGVFVKDIDNTARDFIKKKKYGRYFTHGTGHGVGLQIHEAPSLGPKSNEVLEKGMIITIEPGIYIEGICGVRIEDMVLVTDKGFEVLTDFTKEFIEL